MQVLVLVLKYHTSNTATSLVGVENIDTFQVNRLGIRYHKGCWGRNVTPDLLKDENDLRNAKASCEHAENEFLSEVDRILNENSFEALTNLTQVLNRLRSSNGISKLFTNKQTKQLLLRRMPDLMFTKPVRENESERVAKNEVKIKAMQHLESSEKSGSQEDAIHSAAIILRKAILQTEAWTFTGALDPECICGTVIPDVLLNFFHVLLSGKSALKNENPMTSIVRKRAINLSQITMSSTLTRKQTHDNKATSIVRKNLDLPLQVGVGLSMHATFRNKEIIDILHGLCLSMDYNKILKIENQLANHAIAKMVESHDGVLFYVPKDFVKGRHVYFAADNCDFQEDTIDGKNTLHGTVMTVYQNTEPTDVVEPLEIDPDTRTTLEDVDMFNPFLRECNVPAKPKCTQFEDVVLHTGDNKKPELNWLLMYSEVMEMKKPEDGSPPQLNKHDLPLTWAAYKSLLHGQLKKTRIHTPQILDAYASEFSTLMHIFKQANAIKTIVVGPNSKTVLTLDMGLYLPAQKLLMSKREEFKHIILRPGELHIVIAMLRSIGSYINESGIDSLWIQSGLYGQNTVHQIIEGNHIKRGIRAHIVTLVALTRRYMSSFYESLESGKELKQNISEKLRTLHQTAKNEKDTSIMDKVYDVGQCLKQNGVLELMENFEENGTDLQKSICTYMDMVMHLLQFIHAVRGSHWDLHLKSLTGFCKYFFALDRLRYARMIPLYLMEMERLKTSDPMLYHEFKSGHWVVNRSATPFCLLGADHALEQINRCMKVSGGLISITTNEKARARFFLISPDLSLIKSETKLMANVYTFDNENHHELNKASETLLAEHIAKVEESLFEFVDPFSYKGKDIINIVSRAIMPDKVKEGILKLEENGKTLMNGFVEKRLQKNDIDFWDPMKKANVQLWKSTTKKISVTLDDKVTELREDRALFARLLIVANSRPDVDLGSTMGEFELSVVPRSLIHSNGKLHHCSDKSQLLRILEGKTCPHLGIENETKRIAVVDAMNIVQSLSKPKWVKTAQDLANHFIYVVTEKYGVYEEVHIIFDNYTKEASMKSDTRDHRLNGRKAIAYHISSTTLLENVDMKTLLSSSDTKDELTKYFAESLVRGMSGGSTIYVASYREKVVSTHGDYTHLESSHEEADTKLILHGIDVAKRGLSSLHIYSMDTDVFVLCIRRYTRYLPHHTVLFTGSGDNRRTIVIKDVVDAIGVQCADALPAFHAFSGADITGCIVGKGKQSYWNVFENADEDIIEAFRRLSDAEAIDTEIISPVEKFVCKLYQPGTNIMKLADLRWWLFRRKQAESEKLPPTKAALVQYIKRTLYQCLIWCNDRIPKPEEPNPTDYGWELRPTGYYPIGSTKLPAPKAILELVKCGCTKSMCNSGKCKCRANGLVCTELCTCGADDYSCKNCVPVRDDDDDMV